MATSANSENGDPGFQIAPMVDVVFVLMLFFMASAGLKMKELELDAKLPKQGQGITPPIVIDIAADGEVAINERTYAAAGDRSLADLRRWLGEARGLSSVEDPVILHPAAEARHERIMDVLGATAASGVRKVTFQ